MTNCWILLSYIFKDKDDPTEHPALLDALHVPALSLECYDARTGSGNLSSPLVLCTTKPGINIVYHLVDSRSPLHSETDGFEYAKACQLVIKSVSEYKGELMSRGCTILL